MSDPNHNEYLAAIAGLPDQTPSPPRPELDGFGRGDHVSFRLAGWSDNSYDDGRVIDIHEGRQKLLVETANDIVEVDPSEVLPF